MIVENSPAGAHEIVSALRMSDLLFSPTRVYTLADLEEQLARARPDVVVSEYALRHFNGLDVLRVTQEYEPQLPVIITTTRRNAEFAARCVAKGAIDFVPREELREIAASLSRALNIRSALERAFASRLRHSEQALERWADIVQRIPVYIADISPAGEILSINKTRSPGLRPDEAAGTSVFDYVAKEHHRTLRASFDKALRIGEESTMEVTARDSRRAEELEIEIHVSRGRDQGARERLILIASEVTELKRAQRALYQDNRLTQVGMIAAGVAHDINNSLGGVYGHLEMALDVIGSAVSGSAGADESLRNVEAKIHAALTAAQLIGDIIQNLQEYYAQDDKRTVLIDLNAELDAAIKMTRGKFKYEVEIDRRVDKVPYVRGSRVQIRQVLINLVLNAWHAVVNLPQERRRISVSTRFERKRVCAEVADRGDGIPPELTRKIFEPFFTTRAEDGGSGLGLYICKRIIEAHGGDISLESVVGEGSRFTIELPSADANAPSAGS